jgi:hypothetical protein
MGDSCIAVVRYTISTLFLAFSFWLNERLQILFHVILQKLQNKSNISTFW